MKNYNYRIPEKELSLDNKETLAFIGKYEKVLLSNMELTALANDNNVALITYFKERQEAEDLYEDVVNHKAENKTELLHTAEGILDNRGWIDSSKVFDTLMVRMKDENYLEIDDYKKHAKRLAELKLSYRDTQRNPMKVDKDKFFKILRLPYRFMPNEFAMYVEMCAVKFLTVTVKEYHNMSKLKVLLAISSLGYSLDRINRLLKLKDVQLDFDMSTNLECGKNRIVHKIVKL